MAKTILMKKILLLLCLILGGNSLQAQNQDPWTEYMTPSKMHQMLEKYVGNFEMEISMDMGGQKNQFMVDSQHAMHLGGRFLELKQKGSMMGMDYEATTIIGFNNSERQFALTTITNMGTGTLSLFGPWDEPTKSANLSGQLTNPLTKKPINVRQNISFIDEDSFLIESFDQEGNNPEVKTVQYKFSRKK